MNRVSRAGVYGRLDWLWKRCFPGRCRLCHAAGHNDMDICRPCASELPLLQGRCPNCAAPRPHDNSSPCPRCQRRRPPFHTVVCPLLFQEPVRGLIHEFKFSRRLAVGSLLCDLFVALTAPQDPGVLMPVPMHPRRLRRRGFNPALELAAGLARRGCGELWPGGLRRRIDTVTQSQLPAARRETNLVGAITAGFRVAPPRRVVVVDDVMTSGSTAAACASALLDQGVVRVDVWVVARA